MSLLILHSVGTQALAENFKDVFRIVHRRADGVTEVTLLKSDQVVIQGSTTQISSKISKQYLADLEKAIPPQVSGDQHCLPASRWEVTLPKSARYFCGNAAVARSLNEITANLRVIASK